MVGDSLSVVVQNISTVLAGGVIVFSTNWKLAFFILALAPLRVIQGWVQIKFM